MCANYSLRSEHDYSPIATVRSERKEMPFILLQKPMFKKCYFHRILFRIISPKLLTSCAAVHAQHVSNFGHVESQFIFKTALCTAQSSFEQNQVLQLMSAEESFVKVPCFAH